MPSSKRSADTTGRSLSVVSLDKPIARSSSGMDDKTFIAGLILRLASMTQAFRLAKVMLKEPEGIQIIGFLRDEWTTKVPMATIRGIRFGARSMDPQPMPQGCGKFQCVGGVVNIPVANIKGFMWAPDEEENEYFKQFSAYLDEN